MTALLVGLGVALTPTACGVPPSDVIEVGEPASVVIPPSPKHAVLDVVSLYFLHDGELTAYPRKIGHSADLGTVVDMLFGGPTTSEAVTATTELPRLRDTQDLTGPRGISVSLPSDVTALSHAAMLQLACTVAHVNGSLAARPADTTITVYGDGWTMTLLPHLCPDAPQP
ncbi:hypothetical protein ACFZAV_34315 [Streptomyces sp. NPDC008343]|uniref:hypothetical protein n=1 Tax=Streptomyces sp. NPDC008343 TaxID=3364828 RepID=UPI0036E6FB99